MKGIQGKGRMWVEVGVWIGLGIGIGLGKGRRMESEKKEGGPLFHIGVFSLAKVKLGCPSAV